MKNWEKAEKQDAKGFGTKRQRGSGNSDHYPTDSVSDMVAIETKYTDKGSYSVSLEKWQKLVEEVAVLNAKDNKLRIPILSLHIQNKRLVVLDFDDYRRLEEKAARYEDLQY